MLNTQETMDDRTNNKRDKRGIQKYGQKEWTTKGINVEYKNMGRKNKKPKGINMEYKNLGRNMNNKSDRYPQIEE